MKLGALMIVTGYSMATGELARALEERGREDFWAPELSCIPLTRLSPSPGSGELPKPYYDVMDPFVVLTAAAAAARMLLVGTGVCLVAQRDPVQTAKLVALLGQVSGGTCSASATGGTGTRRRTTARCPGRATSWRASGSRP
jgi:alkanesulfonate monooxygenase SsuD/methylene tetrahydromethanopterin reductase-like flavin-dependent oxidoreductase (luciferase family)